MNDHPFTFEMASFEWILKSSVWTMDYADRSDKDVFYSKKFYHKPYVLSVCWHHDLFGKLLGGYTWYVAKSTKDSAVILHQERARSVPDAQWDALYWLHRRVHVLGRDELMQLPLRGNLEPKDTQPKKKSIRMGDDCIDDSLLFNGKLY